MKESHMATVASVHIWRPLPGKFQEFMAIVGKAKKIHERLGGHVRVRSTQFGGTPSSVIYAIEHAGGWSAFGAFTEKLATDSEWLSLGQSAQANPTAELASSAVTVEVDV
jgi:hypothetical protein